MEYLYGYLPRFISLWVSTITALTETPTYKTLLIEDSIDTSEHRSFLLFMKTVVVKTVISFETYLEQLVGITLRTHSKTNFNRLSVR